MTSHTTSQPGGQAGQAELEAARLLLAKMGLSPADLLEATSDRPPAPTFAEYVPVVSAAVTAGARKTYGSYWNRLLEHWADRRIDEPTPSELEQLVEHVSTHVVLRRTARGGRGSAEHMVAALRCLYKHAVADGWISTTNNPAGKIRKPRRLPSPRQALPDARLAEINQVAATTGNDPALDCLLLRLHTETACRRGGALALRPCDLDSGAVPDPAAGEGRHRAVAAGLTDPDDPPAAACGRAAQLARRCAAAVRQRPAADLSAVRPSVGPDRPAPAVGGRPADQYALAAAHHADLGRTPLRLRGGQGVRRPHRPRRSGRRHRRLRPRHPRRGRHRTSRPHRRSRSDFPERGR